MAHSESVSERTAPIEIEGLACDVVGAQIQGRRKRQEDAFAFERLDGAILLILADGMGGHPCGDDASRITVAAVRRAVMETFTSRMTARECGTMLINAMQAAHAAVKRHGARCSECVGLGATLIAALVLEDDLVFVAAGDSLFYRLGQDGALSLLNTRHVRNQRLTFCIGFKLPDDEAAVAIHPLQDIDALLLASDGLETLSEPEIRDILAGRDDTGAIVQTLLKSVTAAGLDDQDNATALLLRLSSPAKPAPAMAL